MNIFNHYLKGGFMSETIKATIIGTIIIGLFMLGSVKIMTNTVWNISRKSREYVDINKKEVLRIFREEKRKAKEVYLEAAEINKSK